MIPKENTQMVFSVPHSGTTSLCQHLNLYIGGSKSGHRHFTWPSHEEDIRNYRGEVHIPLRDPIDITLSWESRYPTDPAHSWEILRDGFENMIDYEHSGVKFWYTDELPLWKGKGPQHPTKYDRQAQLQVPRVQSLLQWYNDSTKAQSFYKRFFPDGFWWT